MGITKVIKKTYSNLFICLIPRKEQLEIVVSKSGIEIPSYEVICLGPNSGYSGSSVSNQT